MPLQEKSHTLETPEQKTGKLFLPSKELEEDFHNQLKSGRITPDLVEAKISY